MFQLYCKFNSFVSSNFILISAYTNLSTSFLKSILGSRIGEGCADLYFIAVFRNCCVKIIIKISVIFYHVCKKICFSS